MWKINKLTSCLVLILAVFITYPSAPEGKFSVCYTLQNFPPGKCAALLPQPINTDHQTGFHMESREGESPTARHSNKQHSMTRIKCEKI